MLPRCSPRAANSLPSKSRCGGAARRPPPRRSRPRAGGAADPGSGPSSREAGAAREAAERSRIGALIAEVERAERTLVLPAARLVQSGSERPLVLAEVEAILASPNLVVDACRRAARHADRDVRLARRPVLFALLRAMAEAWPGDASRETLCERAFGARRANASHRARLRVELGRLRQELRSLADVRATARGFELVPRSDEVLVLAPPIEN